MKKYLITALTLFAVCGISALSLGLLNNVLSPVIEENTEKREKDALQEIFEGFSNYTTEELSISLTHESMSDVKATITKKYVGEVDGVSKVIYKVEGTNRFGNISMLVGIDENKELTKVEYTEFIQTKDASKIKTQSDKYVGDTTYEAADTISGVTVGSTLVNHMIQLVFTTSNAEVN